MFTGIIEGLGKVLSLVPFKEGKMLTLAPPFNKDLLTIGQSISINGVCLTISSMENSRVSFFLSKITLKTTNLPRLRPGEEVNMERPLRLNQELGGHILTGHIDEISTIKRIKGQELCLAIPESVSPYMVLKGSVAVDGISLTISAIDDIYFYTNIIPHTWENTNLKKRRVRPP